MQICSTCDLTGFKCAYANFWFKESCIINSFFAHFSVMERDGKSSGNNVVDQQTQTPGDGVSITFRSQLKNATRNIKNRWSSSGADAATGIMTGTCTLTRFL